MTRTASPKLVAYASLALARPEAAALAAPFALVLAAGLALAREPEVRVRLELDRERLLQGERFGVELEVHAVERGGRTTVLLELANGLVVEEGTNPVAIQLAPDERRALELVVRAERWGGYAVGDVIVRVEDALGLFAYERRVDCRTDVKVYPGGEVVRSLLRPKQTQLFAGHHVSRLRGDGIEFADLRPFLPGDRPRRINWRASARRRELWVNEAHPERSADVVIFLDTFAEARRAGESTIDDAVSAAASLAAQYLAAKDRVGLVSFGGILKWLTASTGPTQLYRIVDSLLDTEIFLSYAWKDVDVIPRRTLPPQALVVAITPLLDERSLRALLDLRRRAFDLAVIEVSPVPFARVGTGDLDELAFRIWKLRREAMRARFASFGVPVAEWRRGESLTIPIEEVRSFRRHARTVRV